MGDRYRQVPLYNAFNVSTFALVLVIILQLQSKYKNIFAQKFFLFIYIYVPRIILCDQLHTVIIKCML